MEISVILSEKLSSPYEPRYVIVEKDNPEHILDDAQGYGYKTKRNAFACLGYKNRDKSKEKVILSYIKAHKKVIDSFDDAIFYEVKDDPDFKLDSDFIKTLFEENDLKFEGFTPSEFLRVFKRR